MSTNPRGHHEIELITDAITDSIKSVLPTLIEKQLRTQLPDLLAKELPKRKSASRELSAAELAAMGERHRASLIGRGFDPDTLQRLATLDEQRAERTARIGLQRKIHAARSRSQGMTGAAARRQHR